MIRSNLRIINKVEYSKNSGFSDMEELRDLMEYFSPSDDIIREFSDDDYGQFIWEMSREELEELVDSLKKDKDSVLHYIEEHVDVESWGYDSMNDEACKDIYNYYLDGISAWLEESKTGEFIYVDWY